jgi:hypothetical protein
VYLLYVGTLDLVEEVFNRISVANEKLVLRIDQFLLLGEAAHDDPLEDGEECGALRRV